VPPREWRVRMTDILEAAERALAYVQGLTYEQFAADARTVDAVSYAIVLIGEAAKAVPEAVMAAAPEIPWADIRGMRNKVAHEYFGERTLADGAPGFAAAPGGAASTRREIRYGVIVCLGCRPTDTEYHFVCR